MIHVLSCGSSSSSSKRAREEDTDAPLLIPLDIGDCIVRQILVDTGSIANVLFQDTVVKMGVLKNAIWPCQVSLIGYMGQTIKSTGIIELLVKVNGTKWNIEFLVVDAPFSYNGFLADLPLTR